MTSERINQAGEFFSSRWGVLFTALGMAIGTGNIWRFPRVAAQNGGGAFLIPWILFLFTWSIPLLILEFGMGRAARKGTIGAFASLAGRRFAWAGGFVGVCTLAIMFYYSVVTGWCLKFLWASMAGGLWGAEPEAYWQRFADSQGWQPVWFQFLALLFGCWIIHRGVNRGLERVNRIIVPLLFTLLAATAVRALTLPGAGEGLAFLFRPQWSQLGNYEVWLAALSQSAWSTGAGWGLILTIGVYLRREETVLGHALATGIGNNVASLLAATAVLPTIFFRYSRTEALEIMGKGNEGLSFVILPEIFREMPFGRIFMAIFFLALSLAAISSLITMIELGTRLLIDAGWTRHRAVWFIGAAGLMFGLPSALWLPVFKNQDWVWGLGLMVSGFLFALAIGFCGVRRFRERYLPSIGAGRWVGAWFDVAIRFLIPAQFVAMIVWWFYQAITLFDPTGWWNPLHVASVGTCLLQWGAVLTVLVVFNRRIAARMTAD
jgi:NSS family neurotransmitter:Na+ symporter